MGCYENVLRRYCDMKINKTIALNGLSAAFATASFVVNLLLNKAQNEAIAKRAAKIVRRRH